MRGPVFLKYLTDSSYSALKEWELEYYMEQLRKTIESQLTVATVDKDKYTGIEDRLIQLDKDINEILKELNKNRICK